MATRFKEHPEQLEALRGASVKNDHRLNEPGDVVLTTLTRRGKSGWSYSEINHLALLDHRYGSFKERAYMIPLCGRDAAVADGTNRAADAQTCKGCLKKAEQLELVLPS